MMATTILSRVRMGIVGRWAAAVFVAALVAACGGAADETDAAAGGGASEAPAGSASVAPGGDTGESFTMGYSAPFLFADFEVVLQEQTVATAEAAGIEVLAPTNADGDSGKQNTDIRNLISAGAEGLIVVANDSNAIVPALEYANSQGVPVVSLDIGPDGGNIAAIVRADNIAMGRMACEAMAEAIGGEGKVLSLQGAATSINGRERTQGSPSACRTTPTSS